MTMRGHPDGCTQTYSGAIISLHDPQPETILIEDIAHHLANICRFGGATRWHYSVAQHCVYVSVIVERYLRDPRAAPSIAWSHEETVPRAGAPIVRAALLHDAAEAYIGDLRRPIKRQPELAHYRQVEDHLLAVILQRFGVSPEIQAAFANLIGDADNILLATEQRDLLQPASDPDHWSGLPRPAPEQIIPWYCPGCTGHGGITPRAAKDAFLLRFAQVAP